MIPQQQYTPFSFKNVELLLIMYSTNFKSVSVGVLMDHNQEVCQVTVVLEVFCGNMLYKCTSTNAVSIWLCVQEMSAVKEFIEKQLPRI